MESSTSDGGFKKRKISEDTVSNPSSSKKQKQCSSKTSKKPPSQNADLTSGPQLLIAQNAETNSQRFFTHLVFHIVEAGLGKARTDIFCKQITKYGGKVEGSLSNDVTHLVVDEQMDVERLCRILKIKEPPQNVKILKASWISSCLSEQELKPTEEYQLKIPSKVLAKDEPGNDDAKPKDDSSATEGKNLEDTGLTAEQLVSKEDETHDAASTSDNPDGDHAAEPTFVPPLKTGQPADYDSDESSYVPSDEDDYQKALESTGQSSSNASTPNTSPTKLPKGNWVCARASSSIVVNQNKLITDKLEVLLKTYENTRDRWRALSYKKAISALKRHPKDITSWEEANSIPGIGKALADKVWEIARTGHLRKIDYVCKGDDIEALNLFNNIWGVGPTVAQEWVTQGLRTLDDVRDKAKLSSQQQIGMKHYSDFLERMPREEAGDIERTVREMAKTLHPDMMAVVCGSYRRGKQTCGDVDVLITNPDNKALKGVLSRLLDALKQTGFITDDLIRVEGVAGEQPRKYMGVCKLPGENTKYRRIDIIVAPYNEYPCALLHFTGSGHFNRSMRALAKKKGMSLSEHALCTGVVRSGTVKIHQGTPLRVTAEQDVFRYLGLQYRDPEERDH